MEKQKTRSEIEEKYKWDLTTIYETIEKYEQDIKIVKEEIEHVKKYKD